MRTTFREPQVEEAVHNIILQNRCGNRLSLLMGEGHTDLEFVYKPNAFRRKEYRARNFSNRDNFTTLFAECLLEELRAPVIKEFDYDPFITRLSTLAPSGAKNSLTFLNIADENCFAIAARCPLVLAVRPKRQFTLEEGLITESFADRGEEIVSFVNFPGIEESRYRVRDDGTHIIQLIANDVVLIGGEENLYQVGRVIRALRHLSLDELISRNDRLLATPLSAARIDTADADIARIYDLNKRHTYSGIDEGGACFGCLNRIYHLIWTRDGSLAAGHYAAAGFTQIIKLWAPFVLANPAKITEYGKTITAWQQLFGTRWSKSEDDGLFYAAWALFAHFQATGDVSLVRSEAFETLLAALEDAIATRWDAKLGLFVSDTRGESSLFSSPYFGYDVVNGNTEAGQFVAVGKKVISRYVGSYQNMVQYNVLRMVDCLLGQRPDLRNRFSRDYAEFASLLGNNINNFFIGPDGHYRPEYHIYDDGTAGYPDWMHIDYWEYPFAHADFPFHPNIAAGVVSMRAYFEIWPKCRNYGFPPWNTMIGLCFEYGMKAAEARKLFDQEIREALLLTRKYPMPGVLTEYANEVESWRGLPISASSFAVALTGMLLKSLAQGLAVRAGGLIDAIHEFNWMIYRIDAVASGAGESVDGVTVNGQRLVGTLQIPQNYLRPGANRIEITRTAAFAEPRLYSSTLMLLDARQQGTNTILTFTAANLGEVIVENASRVQFRDSRGAVIAAESRTIPDTRLTIYTLRAPDGLSVEL